MGNMVDLGALLFPDQGHARQPQTNLEIDWSNPDTRDLALAWFGNHLLHDFSDNNVLTKYGASFSPIFGPSGIAINSTGDNSTDRIDLGSVAPTDPLNGQNGITIIALVGINSGTLNNGYPRLIDKSDGSGGKDGWMLEYDATTTKSMGFQVNSGTSIFSTSQVPVGKPFVTAVSCTQGGAVNFYTNGLPDGSGTTAAIPSITTNAALFNWNHTTDRQWNGWAEYVLVFGRVLSADAIARVSQNAYALLKTPSIGWPAVASANGTGTGALPTASLMAPASTASGSAIATSAPSSIALSSPGAAATGSAVAVGSFASLALLAPAANASVSASITVTPSHVSLSAPTATANGSAVAQGALQAMSMVAPTAHMQLIYTPDDRFYVAMPGKTLYAAMPGKVFYVRM